jgi:uncharacterized membrane protein
MDEPMKEDYPMPRLARLAALTLASLAMAATARADINLCNDFHAPIRVALAQPTTAGVAATGWWKLDPGVCHPVDYTLDATELYYSAVSNPYRQGGGMLRYNWGNLLAAAQAKAKTVTIRFIDGGTTVRVSAR